MTSCLACKNLCSFKYTSQNLCAGTTTSWSSQCTCRAWPGSWWRRAKTSCRPDTRTAPPFCCWCPGCTCTPPWPRPRSSVGSRRTGRTGMRCRRWTGAWGSWWTCWSATGWPVTPGSTSHPTTARTFWRKMGVGESLEAITASSPVGLPPPPPPAPPPPARLFSLSLSFSLSGRFLNIKVNPSYQSFRLWFLDTVLWLCPSLPTETLKWLSSLPILMQESFWWWQCSDRYIISLFSHLHTPIPFSPSLISLTVSVDVKHHVYQSFFVSRFGLAVRR